MGATAVLHGGWAMTDDTDDLRDQLHRLEVAMERMGSSIETLAQVKTIDHARIEERITAESHNRRKTDGTVALILDRFERLVTKDDHGRLEAAVMDLRHELQRTPDRDDYDRLAAQLAKTDEMARSNQLSLAKMGVAGSIGGGVFALITTLLQNWVGGGG